MVSIILATVTGMALLTGLAIAFKAKSYSKLAVRPRRYEKGQE